MLQLAETNRIDTNEFENGVVAYNEKFFKEFTGVKKWIYRDLILLINTNLMKK